VRQIASQFDSSGLPEYGHLAGQKTYFCPSCRPTCALFSSLAKAEFPQEKDHSSSEKRVVNRIEPEYPETLKRLYIGGIVRIQVTVDPSGRVASTELLGGSPILGQSAMKAVKRWKYVPAANTEKFVVQLEFDPHR
jgi:TonB family protein